MPAGATTDSTGWLWRKMSKIHSGAKRQWRGRFRGLSTAVRDFHISEGSNGESFVDIFQNFSYYVLWVLEGVVVVAGFCFFFLRFGGRL
ncbi:hypothetical protein FCM35_KLT15738 [Carex littledalei]|uniref:Uncharacterized protein n=1 Tax=Carex littledalei TaxID=544730 RepID=A0A833RI68_9POAL|nr:hypothetical protein FCM35_KLT15738 [Carex littledalei]